MPRIEPLYDRVVVEELESGEQRTESGLFIATQGDTVCRGRVLAIGTGRLTEHGETVPLKVREGDTLLFSQHAGTEVVLSGETYRVLREAEVISILHEDD